MQELEKALITCAEDLEAVYVYVDAVNESQHTTDILQSIKQHYNSIRQGLH